MKGKGIINFLACFMLSLVLLTGCGGGGGNGNGNGNENSSINPPDGYVFYGENFSSQPTLRRELECEGNAANIELGHFQTKEEKAPQVSRKKADDDSQVSAFVQSKVKGFLFDFFTPDGSGGLNYRGSWQVVVNQPQKKRIPPGEYYLRVSSLSNDFGDQPVSYDQLSKDDLYRGYWAERWDIFEPNKEYTLNIDLARNTFTGFPVSLSLPTLEDLSEPYTFSFGDGFSALTPPELKNGRFEFVLGCSIVPETGEYPNRLEITLPNGPTLWENFNILSILTGDRLQLEMKDDQSGLDINICYPPEAKNTIESPADNTEVGPNFVISGVSQGMPDNEVHLSIKDHTGADIEMIATAVATRPGQPGGYQFSVNSFGRIAPGEVKAEVFGLSNGKRINRVALTLTLTGDSLEGKLIKPDGCLETVLYFINNGHKYLIGGENAHTQAVLASWNLNSVDAVLMDKALVEQIPNGGSIYIRAGRNILHTSEGKYYLIGMKGIIHEISQEGLISLYGTQGEVNYYESMLVTISQDALHYYIEGTCFSEMDSLPNGLLVKGPEAQVYMIMGLNKCPLSQEIWTSGLLGQDPVLLSQEELARYGTSQEVTTLWECLYDPTQETLCGIPVELSSSGLENGTVEAPSGKAGDSDISIGSFLSSVPPWIEGVKAKLISVKFSCPMGAARDLKIFYGSSQIGSTITTLSDNASTAYNFSCDLPLSGEHNFVIQVGAKAGLQIYIQGHADISLATVVNDSYTTTGPVSGQDFYIAAFSIF